MAYMSPRNTSRTTQSSQQRISGSVRSSRTMDSDSSDDSDSDEPDHEAIRNLHRKRYPADHSDGPPKRPEPEIVRTPSIRRTSDVPDRWRYSRHSIASSTNDRSRNSSRHEHRSRRSGTADDRSDVVYRRKLVPVESKPVRSSSVLLPQRRASFIPDVLQSLRAPRLSSKELPVRTIQTVRRADSQSSSSRRHSYHGPELQKHVRTVRRVVDSRSSSRHSVRRSASPRTTSRAPISRPIPARNQTVTRRPSAPTRTISRSSHVEGKAAPIVRRAERPVSIFGSLWGGLSRPAEPERTVECLTCLSDDIPISKSARLACGHRMCNPCLRRIFTMSVTDPAHMPPKCCTADHIPLHHVERLFDTKFKIKWNKKYQEYTTKNRLYCPTRGCGEWIKPANIHIDGSGGANGGRKYGKCTRCKTKVCATCNRKWHASRECPKDEATAQFVEIAKREGWQRCFNCSAMVELKEGCNHMTCRCRAEFCMICGLKWKSCDCPWFNYQAVENDRLLHMNQAAPFLPQAPPRAYHEELGARGAQERRDAELARRLYRMNLDIPIDVARYLDPDNFVDFGNALPHQTNDRYDFRPPHGRPPPQTPFVHAPTVANLAQEYVAPQPPPQVSRSTSRRQKVRARTPPPPAPEVQIIGEDEEAEEVVEVPLRRKSMRQERTQPNAKTLAGLDKPTTKGRVNEWRRYVEPGLEEVPVV